MLFPLRLTRALALAAAGIAAPFEPISDSAQTTASNGAYGSSDLRVPLWISDSVLGPSKTGATTTIGHPVPTFNPAPTLTGDVSAKPTETGEGTIVCGYPIDTYMSAKPTETGGKSVVCIDPTSTVTGKVSALPVITDRPRLDITQEVKTKPAVTATSVVCSNSDGQVPCPTTLVTSSKQHYYSRGLVPNPPPVGEGVQSWPAWDHGKKARSMTATSDVVETFLPWPPHGKQVEKNDDDVVETSITWPPHGKQVEKNDNEALNAADVGGKGLMSLDDYWKIVGAKNFGMGEDGREILKPVRPKDLDLPGLLRPHSVDGNGLLSMKLDDPLVDGEDFGVGEDGRDILKPVHPRQLDLPGLFKPHSVEINRGKDEEDKPVARED